MRSTAPDASQTPPIFAEGFNKKLVSYRPLAINLLLLVLAKKYRIPGAFLANSLLEPRDLLLRAASNSLRLADAF